MRFSAELRLLFSLEQKEEKYQHEQYHQQGLDDELIVVTAAVFTVKYHEPEIHIEDSHFIKGLDAQTRPDNAVAQQEESLFVREEDITAQ